MRIFGVGEDMRTGEGEGWRGWGHDGGRSLMRFRRKDVERRRGRPERRLDVEVREIEGEEIATIGLMKAILTRTGMEWREKGG